MVFFNRRRGDSMIRQLEYIQSSGTQCIDTGFAPNQNTRVVLAFEASQLYTDNFVLFGARQDTKVQAYSLWLSDGSQINGQYGSIAYNTQPITLNYAQPLVYDFNKNVLSVGGQSKTFGEATINPQCSLYLLSINTDGEIDERRPMGKLSYCRVYDNGTLVRDYIPCLDDASVACLYDRVNKQYVYNAGSGSFIAGPEL